MKFLARFKQCGNFWFHHFHYHCKLTAGIGTEYCQSPASYFRYYKVCCRCDKVVEEGTL